MSGLLDAILVWWGGVGLVGVASFFGYLFVSALVSCLRRDALENTGGEGHDV